MQSPKTAPHLMIGHNSPPCRIRTRQPNQAPATPSAMRATSHTKPTPPPHMEQAEQLRRLQHQPANHPTTYNVQTHPSLTLLLAWSMGEPHKEQPHTTMNASPIHTPPTTMSSFHDLRGGGGRSIVTSITHIGRNMCVLYINKGLPI